MLECRVSKKACKRGALTEFLDKLLVLVQLLERLHVHHCDSKGGGLLAMLSISEHAHLHLGAGDIGEGHGAAETLVFLGIVVLETDLELDGLRELALLLL
jgi:hypothetical protein